MIKNIVNVLKQGSNVHHFANVNNVSIWIQDTMLTLDKNIQFRISMYKFLFRNISIYSIININIITVIFMFLMTKFRFLLIKEIIKKKLSVLIILKYFNNNVNVSHSSKFSNRIEINN